MSKPFVKYLTPVFRLSFHSLFELPKQKDDSTFDNNKYYATAIWTPSLFTENDKKAWVAIRKGLNDLSLERFKIAFDKLPANYKKGLRDGEEKADIEGYGPGTIFATLSTRNRPGVVNANLDPINSALGNTDEVYSGCYARAFVSFYAYDNKSKGIGIGLQSLQKVADGSRFDRKTDAVDDFAGVDIDAEYASRTTDQMDDDAAVF